MSLCPVIATSMTTPDSLTDFELEIAKFIVSNLNLEVLPAEIKPSDPLYGDGLGLDSIDVLEIALAVSKQYGFQMRSDDANNTVIFSSLRNLAAHIATHRG
jgi:acyl carrier protein